MIDHHEPDLQGKMAPDQPNRFRVVLYEPEIPANTGNIGRLCVAVGAELHLIGRLGFHIDDRSVRRAGLDYWQELAVYRHVDLAAFESLHPAERLFCFSAHAPRVYTEVSYQPGDAFVFGGESHGLPPEVLSRHAGRVLRIPIPTGKVRSLNLATAVGIVVYEALRQVEEDNLPQRRQDAKEERKEER
jgi:tRNA (cytidine/uridine-2'-O-)-methyltransferase